MKISVVTPSYNQARFIQTTIDSVLSQDYPDLEYLIMDGGSTDLTVPILRTYGDAIQWVSEPDGGQSGGVNKGILRASGDVIGWLNSDDIYYPGAIRAVMEVFENHPEVNILYGDADHIREDGAYIEDYYTEPWNYERLQDICFLCQPAVFFRRETVLKYGLLNPKRHFAMDYDLWLRMGKHEEFYYLRRKLAGSRLYAENKTLGFVDRVHVDIMDTLLENTGAVSDRWLEGSANTVTRSLGYGTENADRYREHVSSIARFMLEYSERYRPEEKRTLKDLPFCYAPMKFGIDVSTCTAGNHGGVPAYTEEMAKSLPAMNRSSQFYLYSAFGDVIPAMEEIWQHPMGGKNAQQLFFAQDTSLQTIRQNFSSGESEKLMAMLGQPNAVLCPAFAFSRKLSECTATLYTIFDLSFLEHPEYSTRENYENCFRNVFEASIYADHFVSISQYSKDVFLKYFPHVAPDRITVTPLGFRACFREEVNCEKELSAFDLSAREPFWLFVGTVEPRKNLVSLIRAYAKLKEKGKTFPLVIAGGKGWLDSEIYEEVRKQKLENDVRFLGFVTDIQLTALYRSCYAVVYPSYYEGFGLPVLEAMAAGAAVITSNTTSMPEVGGDAVLYVDPKDISSIVTAMDRLQRDEALRNEMGVRGKERAFREFSQERCAQETYKCLYKAIQHFMDRKDGRIV